MNQLNFPSDSFELLLFASGLDSDPQACYSLTQFLSFFFSIFLFLSFPLALSSLSFSSNSAQKNPLFLDPLFLSFMASSPPALTPHVWELMQRYRTWSDPRSLTQFFFFSTDVKEACASAD